MCCRFVQRKKTHFNQVNWKPLLHRTANLVFALRHAGRDVNEACTPESQQGERKGLIQNWEAARRSSTTGDKPGPDDWLQLRLDDPEIKLAVSNHPLSPCSHTKQKHR